MLPVHLCLAQTEFPRDRESAVSSRSLLFLRWFFIQFVLRHEFSNFQKKLERVLFREKNICVLHRKKSVKFVRLRLPMFNVFPCFIVTWRFLVLLIIKQAMKLILCSTSYQFLKSVSEEWSYISFIQILVIVRYVVLCFRSNCLF